MGASMWWAGVTFGNDRPSKTVGVQLAALNKSTNADGDPAADGMNILLTVGRCNVEHKRRKSRSAFKGVDLESESQ